MRQRNAGLAIIVILTVSVSSPAFARGHSGGGHGGGHNASVGRSVSGPVHHYGGRAASGVFVGAALAAPLIMASPRYYYPPPRYSPAPPQPAYWYFCPEYNAYYPYVQYCPSGWQPVPARPSY
jgi:hypothetical protein